MQSENATKATITPELLPVLIMAGGKLALLQALRSLVMHSVPCHHMYVLADCAKLLLPYLQYSPLRTSSAVKL